MCRRSDPQASHEAAQTQPQMPARRPNHARHSSGAGATRAVLRPRRPMIFFAKGSRASSGPCGCLQGRARSTIRPAAGAPAPPGPPRTVSRYETPQAVPDQVQSIGADWPTELRQSPRIAGGIGCDDGYEKSAPRPSSPATVAAAAKRTRRRAATTVYVDDDGGHHAEPRRSASMNGAIGARGDCFGRLGAWRPFEAHMLRALKVTGTRCASLKERRVRDCADPGRVQLANAGRMSYTWVHCRLTRTPCRCRFPRPPRAARAIGEFAPFQAARHRLPETSGTALHSRNSPSSV